MNPEEYRKAGRRGGVSGSGVPSPDGSLVAYAISIGNSERATLHIMNMATGKDIGKPIANVLRFGSVDWSHNGSFFYNRAQHQ